MLRRIHVQVDLSNNPFGVDKKRMARGKFGDAKIHHGSIAGGKLTMGVSKQLKVQSLRCAKLFMRSFILPADAEDDRVFVLVKRQVLLKVARFFRAAASEVFRIEVQDHPFSAKIAQP